MPGSIRILLNYFPFHARLRDINNKLGATFTIRLSYCFCLYILFHFLSLSLRYTNLHIFSKRQVNGLVQETARDRSEVHFLRCLWLLRAMRNVLCLEWERETMKALRIYRIPWKWQSKKNKWLDNIYKLKIRFFSESLSTCIYSGYAPYSVKIVKRLNPPNRFHFPLDTQHPVWGSAEISNSGTALIDGDWRFRTVYSHVDFFHLFFKGSAF